MFSLVFEITLNGIMTIYILFYFILFLFLHNTQTNTYDTGFHFFLDFQRNLRRIESATNFLYYIYIYSYYTFYIFNIYFLFKLYFYKIFFVLYDLYFY